MIVGHEHTTIGYLLISPNWLASCQHLFHQIGEFIALASIRVKSGRPARRLIASENLQALVASHAGDHAPLPHIEETPPPEEKDFLGVLSELTCIWRLVRQKRGRSDP